MTLTRLAKLAHVSVSTASKAFSMSPEVNEQTRNLIFDIAKEHGCFKKYYNANYPKLVIAMVCPDLSSSAGLVKILQSRLAEYNCEICVTSANFSAERELELIEYYENYVKADGIILLSPRCRIPESTTTPIAVIDPYDEEFFFNAENLIVGQRSIDDAYREAISYFADKGINDIAFVGDVLSRSKYELFRQFIKEKLGEVDENLISLKEKTGPVGGYEAMKELLDKGYRPRALISAHFPYTIGAARAISEYGLRIPEDIAVISFSYSDNMEFIPPGFTGVQNYDSDCCIRVADALVNKINGCEYEQNIFLRSTINYRNSSKI